MRKTLICLFLACAALHADEDTFREKFADPATRDSALAELIPGTRDAYFHAALAHQLADRESEFQLTMAAWKAASERAKNPVSPAGFETLKNRQLLIDYEKNPAASLAGLIRKFDLKFDDASPKATAAENLPTGIDPELISAAAFETAAAEKSGDQPYSQYTGERLLRELDSLEQFDEPKIRWFLENIPRADLPGIVPLIDQSMKLIRPVPFGSLTLHQKLTAGQLASLLEIQPSLGSNQVFVNAYLEKLLPGAETDFTRDIKAHADHLQRCRDFILPLPHAVDSLKAHVLYHHLRLQAELGNYPKDDFLAFLALPRSQHPLLLVPKNPVLDPIRLNQDFSSATCCPPIPNDYPLIENYLYHFLGATDSAADFAALIPEESLTRIHARARLLAGADPARWSAAIDAAEYKSLQSEARIRFAPGAPQLLDADAPVVLNLDLKNTPDVLIRIYELDLPTHLARGGSEPDVSIDLDGLVPHHERSLKFSQPPIQLHREAIALPELAGAGAWLVDFVGGQVSARALIRKGQLIPYIERTATGQSIRVFDEKGNPVTTAVAKLGQEIISADASGRIMVRNSPNQPLTTGIFQAGKLATKLKLDSREDEFKLQARFHLDREQLLADQKALLHLRVQLTNHGHELPLDRIRNPELVLNARLLSDINIERVITENLKLTPTLEVPFQVPADLLELSFTLRGTIDSPDDDEPTELSESVYYEINGDLTESRIGTAFFSPTAEGHRLEVRGRNGEPLPSCPLTLTFRRDGYLSEITTQVRTDSNGRIELGKLDEISALAATGPSIGKAWYQPVPQLTDFTIAVQISPAQEIRFPLEKSTAAPSHLQLSLLEMREGKVLRDHFEKITIEQGQLVIRGLPPGDYSFAQNSFPTEINVSEGPVRDGLIISPHRILPIHLPLNPKIESALIENDEVKIQIRDSGPATRLTLVGKRYQYPWDSGAAAKPFEPLMPGTFEPGFTGCGFLTERLLSDEMRYIMDRRAATRFPGSLLPRPGLLLNRWTEEDLEQATVDGIRGTGGGSIAPAMRDGRSDFGKFNETPSSETTSLSAVVDFLASPSIVRFDLKPEADGSFKLPLTDFKNSQFIEMIVADSFAADSLVLPLPASETPLRDRRLARPLDPQTHYLATRSATVVAKGATAEIANLLNSDWRAFTTLSDAHQFLKGMTRDDGRLRAFEFLTDWPNFTNEKKLELLATHACHEFHLFLFRKDKAFFDQHVKPLLAQKPEPQFMDDFLLSRDLKSYLRTYAWQRLNAAEKALLSQALPASRATISRELFQRWELEAPAPDREAELFAQTLRGGEMDAIPNSIGSADPYSSPSSNETDGSGMAYLTDKLSRIVIPRIDFEDTTVQEAIDFLRLRTVELDTNELDPSKRGVNFILRPPRSVDSSTSFGADRIRELRLTNVPLAVALKYIGDQARLRIKVDDFAVSLVPQTETGEDLFTRTFRVPREFSSWLTGGAEMPDPFERNKPKLSARPPIIERLRIAGITFNEGSSATLSKNTLLITNSPTELDKIEQLVEAAMADNLSSSRPSKTFARAATDSFASEDFDSSVLPPLNGDPFGPSSDRLALTARAPLALFPYRTRFWQESNYYKNRRPTDETLIPLNRFWLDLAAWDGNGAFLSPHFNACRSNANEALFCLAMLDLPFKAERPEVAIDGSTLLVKATEAMLLFFNDTRRTDELAQETPLLVRQTFTPLDEPFQTVKGRQIENPVNGDFRTGVAYQASLVVTNPTGIGRRIDLLAQIPAGAIPLESNASTLSITDEIEPYGVVRQGLSFYFPAAGDFAVYPLHVSENGMILAHSDARTLRVSDEPAPSNVPSWIVLADQGSNEEILVRLQTENLNSIDLSVLRWRLQDKNFFLKATQLLRDRLHFSPAISSYGFRHDDAIAIREYLENSGAARQLGHWLDSPLLEVRPRVHHDWETLEFDPLVNARAHRFGEGSRFNHEAAREHYHQFLDQLAWKSSLDATDNLTLTAFLFLQDRVQEALVRFDQIDPAKLPGRVNYDYLHTVALFHREKPAEAKAIASQWTPTLPPGLWRDRFQAVIDQANEIAALDQPAIDAKPDPQPAAPKLDLHLTGDGKLRIDHRSLPGASIRLFSVDLEVLFSKNPFLLGEDSNGLDPSIFPNADLTVDFTGSDSETTIDLPTTMPKGNLLVSAESGTTSLVKLLDSSALEIRHLPESRLVQVLDAANTKPLPKTYVKVFSESQTGEITFHKDGYTDLRGKFDYLSSTAIDSSTIKRLAILVSHPEKGARTVIYDR